MVATVLSSCGYISLPAKKDDGGLGAWIDSLEGRGESPREAPKKETETRHYTIGIGANPSQDQQSPPVLQAEQDMVNPEEGVFGPPLFNGSIFSGYSATESTENETEEERKKGKEKDLGMIVNGYSFYGIERALLLSGQQQREEQRYRRELGFNFPSTEMFSLDRGRDTVGGNFYDDYGQRSLALKALGKVAKDMVYTQDIAVIKTAKDVEDTAQGIVNYANPLFFLPGSSSVDLNIRNPGTDPSLDLRFRKGNVFFSVGLDSGEEDKKDEKFDMGFYVVHMFGSGQ